MFTPEERTEFDNLKREVASLKQFIEQNFNQDGTPKQAALVISASDSVTTPVGSIRVSTNLGPRNILIA